MSSNRHQRIGSNLFAHRRDNDHQIGLDTNWANALRHRTESVFVRALKVPTQNEAPFFAFCSPAPYDAICASSTNTLPGHQSVRYYRAWACFLSVYRKNVPPMCLDFVGFFPHRAPIQLGIDDELLVKDLLLHAIHTVRCAETIPAQRTIAVSGAHRPAPGQGKRMLMTYAR